MGNQLSTFLKEASSHLCFFEFFLCFSTLLAFFRGIQKIQMNKNHRPPNLTIMWKKPKNINIWHGGNQSTGTIHCICSFEFALLAHVLFSSKGKHAIHAWLIVTIKFWYQAYERCLTKYKLYRSMQRMLFVCSRENYHGINYTAESKFRKQYQGPKLSLNMPLWLTAWHSG